MLARDRVIFILPLRWDVGAPYAVELCSCMSTPLLILKHSLELDHLPIGTYLHPTSTHPRRISWKISASPETTTAFDFLSVEESRYLVLVGIQG